MIDDHDVVVGYLYDCEADPVRHQTVCRIVARAKLVDEGFGIEPCFRVRFADGSELDALAQNLTPWFPT